MRPGTQRAPAEGGSLAHAAKAVSFGARLDRLAVVTDVDVDEGGVECDRHLRRRGFVGMLQDVCQGFLDDAIDRELHSRRDVEGLTFFTEFDVESGRAHSVDEPWQARELWLRSSIGREVVGP